jgi:hypothetical protein
MSKSRANFPHLSEQKIDELMGEYNNFIPIRDLMKKYGLKARDLCEIPRIFYRNSNQVSLGKAQNQPIDIPTTRKEEYAIGNREPRMRPEKLSFKEAFFLFLFITLEEDSANKMRLRPLNQHIEASFPTTELACIGIDILLNSGIVTVSPMSDIKASFVENGKLKNEPHVPKILWELLLGSSNTEIIKYINHLKEIIGDRNCWPYHWYQEINEVWQLLSVHECIELMRHYAEEFNLCSPKGESVEHILKDLLSSFSVAQVHNLIWRAIDSTAALVTKNNLKYKKTAVVITEHLQKKADKAKNQDLALIKPFIRKYLRTTASYVLHDTFLKHGEVGYTELCNLRIENED